MGKLILNIKINFTLAVIVTNFSESNSGKMFKPIDLKAWIKFETENHLLAIDSIALTTLGFWFVDS